ncbi:uncharacterized protein V6R79_002462 [Siganus canaliculatus]
MELHPSVMELHPPLMELHPPLMELHLPLMELHPSVMELHPPLMELHPPLMELHPPLMELHPPLKELHQSFTLSDGASPSTDGASPSTDGASPSTDGASPSVMELHLPLMELHPPLMELQSPLMELHPSVELHPPVMELQQGGAATGVWTHCGGQESTHLRPLQHQTPWTNWTLPSPAARGPAPTDSGHTPQLVPGAPSPPLHIGAGLRRRTAQTPAHTAPVYRLAARLVLPCAAAAQEEAPGQVRASTRRTAGELPEPQRARSRDLESKCAAETSDAAAKRRLSEAESGAASLHGERRSCITSLQQTSPATDTRSGRTRAAPRRSTQPLAAAEAAAPGQQR